LNKRIIALLTVLALMSTLFVGCSGSSSQSSANQASPASSASPAASSNSSGSGQKYDLTLGTAGTTGTYYVVGAAMSTTVNNVCPELTVVAQATNGGVENLNLIMSEEMELGLTNADAAYWSCYGGGSSFYQAYASPGSVRGAMRLYESQGHMITRADSAINNYADLKGKTVCLGPPSSTIPAMSIAILNAYGIDHEKDITPVYFSIDEGLEKLTDGVIDATFFVAAAPASGLTSAAATNSLKFVDADIAILENILKDYPYYVITQTKEGAYPSLNRVNTLKIYTELCAGAHVPEEAVYLFVKNALENRDQYVDAHVSCQEIVPEIAVQTSAELHPGAARYYKEIGLLN
jgi:TRAP transporter TAXI family solute receptor